MVPDLIRALAQEESLKLVGEEHWVTLQIIRDYYAEPAITQNLRHAAW
jgi:sulfur relay (sulfurtransferase) DsrC/TusE family protein